MQLKFINKKYFNNNFNLIYILIFILLSRFIPHPPNFTPIISLAILCPLFFNNNIISLLLLISGMFLTDLFLGIYQNIVITYFAIILIYYFSKYYFKAKIINLKNIFLGSIFSALIFFILTNFAVWAFGNLYPRNFEGIIVCYMMAIPFFTNTLLSTIFFSILAYISSILTKTQKA